MEFLEIITKAVNQFFLFYMITYSTFLFLSVVVGVTQIAKDQRMVYMRNSYKHEYYVPISVLVPAYNEELTVVETILSLLNQHYKLYEIIIIDDGSTDATAQVLIDRFQMQKVQRPIHIRIPCQTEEVIYESHSEHVLITLISKKNSGKADSLNLGINAARFPYFVAVDADSILDNALENIVKCVLEDDTTVACGGLVRIANGTVLKNGRLIKYRLPNNIWALLQIMEYDRSFLASRKFFDMFNGNLIISGAFGLFKKEIVIDAGGYNKDIIGEDMELVVRLHEYCRMNKIPYTIKYAESAVCWSQAPDTLRDLKKQRRRWHIGMFQSMMKHIRLFMNPKFGLVGSVSFFYYIFYELFSPVIQLIGLIFIGIGYYLEIINVNFMILFYLWMLFFGAVLSLAAFFTRVYTYNAELTFFDYIKVLVICIMENFGYRQMISFFSLMGLLSYRKKKTEWGKIKRKKFEGTEESTS